MQDETAKKTIGALQAEFDSPIITRVIPFKDLKLNKAEYLDHYYSDPKKTFCQNYISPKLRSLRERFGNRIVG